jgi:hypothetical protein
VVRRTEGWTHFGEELAIEQGLAADHPLVEIAQLRFALEAATRLVYLSVQPVDVHRGMCARFSVDRLVGWSDHPRRNGDRRPPGSRHVHAGQDGDP